MTEIQAGRNARIFQRERNIHARVAELGKCQALSWKKYVTRKLGPVGHSKMYIRNTEFSVFVDTDLNIHNRSREHTTDNNDVEINCFPFICSGKFEFVTFSFSRH